MKNREMMIRRQTKMVQRLKVSAVETNFMTVHNRILSLMFAMKENFDN